MSGLKKRDAVLMLIRQHPEGITSTQISSYLEISISTALFLLRGLTDEQAIFRTENGERKRNTRRLYFSSAEQATACAGKKATMGKKVDIFDSCRRNSKNYMITLLLRSVRQPPTEENQ